MHSKHEHFGHTVKIIFPTIICALSYLASFAHAEVHPIVPDLLEIRKRYETFESQSGVLPQTVLLTFVAAEDRRYFEKLPQRSPITFQVAKRYLPPRSGKLHQLAISIAIGNALTHQEILNWYVGEIFLGQSCFGVADAAHAYFGKPVQELQIEEIAFLAAILKAPARFHPIRFHERALHRRNFVLSEMAKSNLISESDAANAIHKPLMTQKPMQRCILDE